MFTLDKGAKRYSKINVLDKPGSGGAYHWYNITKLDYNMNDHEVFADIKFQKGPIKETELNGCFIEDLLNICVHRLECFQEGEFNCMANKRAIDAIETALAFLNSRTFERKCRNVEGYSVK
jgi:hypothetical protein